jgi:hypothetical protein
MNTQAAALMLSEHYEGQRDQLLQRAARILQRAGDRQFTKDEASALETLYCGFGTLDNRIERLHRIQEGTRSR